MRCTYCDLPLSPTSTTRVCPRCHMPTVTGTSAAEKPKQTPVAQSPSWEDSNDSVQLSFPASQQTPYPQVGQLWPPTPTPAPTPLLTVSGPQLSAGELRWESQPLPQTSDSRWASRLLPQSADSRWESRPLPQTSEVHMHKTRAATSNLGFIIASVCVITGGLILILVYFIAAGLPPSTTQTQSITTGSPIVTATPYSTPTAVAPTSTPKPTPTASIGAFPAQQFIANPQMASAVNTTTAQVTQPTTTFRVGQRVYVTFAIHPSGHSGAVCLLWYSNAKTFSHFELAVSSNSTVAYSYTYYATSGPAYVEIYWASDISCSDKMLAQRVSFTVVN
jgi:hypothetical protein